MTDFKNTRMRSLVLQGNLTDREEKSFKQAWTAETKQKQEQFRQRSQGMLTYLILTTNIKNKVLKEKMFFVGEIDMITEDIIVIKTQCPNRGWRELSSEHYFKMDTTNKQPTLINISSTSSKIQCGIINQWNKMASFSQNI